MNVEPEKGGCTRPADRRRGGVPPWRMPELTVRVLDEQDWPIYRVVRLAALQESPGVFGNTYDQEAAADQTYWRSQFTAARRVVAELDGNPCGVVAVGASSRTGISGAVRSVGRPDGSLHRCGRAAR